MRIIHSPLHARHDGGIELHRGELVPSFETPARVAYILSALDRAAMPVETPREFAPEALLRVHDAGFVDFLRIDAAGLALPELSRLCGPFRT